MLLFGLSILFFSANVAAVFPLANLNFAKNSCKNLYNYPLWFISPECYYNADVELEPARIVRSHGYPFEEYTVTTEDGYILRMFRIPARRSHHGQPVFIQHGVLVNSRIFINNRNNSLAFNLANLGYDVWLGNFRATTYAKGHVTYTTKDPAYWNYDLDDMARYDLPAQIEFVANVTGKAGDIIYIGHSQGTATSFMYASDHPNAHTHLRGIIAMSPVAYFDRIRPIQFIARFTEVIKNLLYLARIHGVFYQDFIIPTMLHVCRLIPSVCHRIAELAFGRSRLLPEDLLLFYSNFLTGASVMQFEQFGQIAHSGKFRKLDHGRERNIHLYGQSEPPLYELSRIKIPVFLFYGLNDVISTENNVERILRELGSSEKSMHRIPLDHSLPGFSHLDFTTGTDMYNLLYRPLFDVLVTRLSIRVPV